MKTTDTDYDKLLNERLERLQMLVGQTPSWQDGRVVVRGYELRTQDFFSSGHIPYTLYGVYGMSSEHPSQWHRLGYAKVRGDALIARCQILSAHWSAIDAMDALA